MSIKMKSARAIRIASALAATSLFCLKANAYVTVGDFEGGNNDGFFDWTISSGGSDNGGNPGATPSVDLPAPYYTYSSEGATLGSSALAASLVPPTYNTGYYQGLSWKSDFETDSEGNNAMADVVANKFYEMDVTYNDAEWSGANYANLGLIVNYASAGGANSGFLTLYPNSSANQTVQNYQGFPAYDTSNQNFPGGWDPTDYPGTTTRTLIWDYADYLPSGSSETLGQLIGPNPEYVEFILISSSNVNGIWHFDNVRLSTNQVNATWSNQQGANTDGTYHWGSLANWNTGGATSEALPSNPGDVVTFGNSIGSPETVTLNENEKFQINVGTMNFNSGEEYTIAQGTGGTLTLNGNVPNLAYSQTFGASTMTTTAGSAQINDIYGNQVISAPVALATNVSIAVGQTTNTLTMSGNITGTGGVTLNSSTVATSSGIVMFSGVNTYTGGTTVDSGELLIAPNGSATTSALAAGAVTINGGSVVLANNVSLGSGTATSNVNITSLAITGNGVLDVGNNHLIITYSGASPMSTIYNYLKAGFNNGGWNGTGGIISSTAAAEDVPALNLPKYGIGFSDGNDKINGHSVVTGLSSGQIELKYTLLGDANLDGTVNGSDFSILAANFGQGYSNWDQGNFLYTPAVNGTDFSALAANFGQGDSGAASSVSQADIAALDAFATANGLPLPTISAVPEPTSAALFLLSSAAILARRNRRKPFVTAAQAPEPRPSA